MLIMATKKPETTAIWRLRVPKSLVLRVKEMADAEKRSTTKQAHLLIEEAISARNGASQ